MLDLWRKTDKGVWLHIGLISSLLTTALLLVQPTLLGSLITAVSQGESLASASVTFVAVAAAAMATGALSTLGDKRYTALLERDFRRSVIAGMTQSDTEDPLNKMSASQVLIHDVTVVAEALASFSTKMIPKVLLALGAIIMMIRLDLIMVVVIVVVIAALILTAVPTLRQMGQDEQLLSERRDHLAARAEQMCALRETARGNFTLDVLGTRVLESNDEVFAGQKRLAFLSFRVDPVNTAMTNVTSLVVLGIGAARVAVGALSVGELLSFLMYLFMLAGPLMAVASSLQNLQGQRAAANRLRTVISPAVKMRGARMSLESPGELLPTRADSLELTDVTFATPNRLIVAGLTESIHPGEVVGIKGESGAGKTTLLRMLSGLLEPTSGAVRGIKEAAGIHRISYVAQRPAIIPESLKATLSLYGAGGASEESVDHYLTQFELIGPDRSAEQFIDSFGAGRLSGGEMQRLAIVAAILSQRQILLLDEPTSALGKRHAQLVVKNLEDYASRGNAVVVASHDPTIIEAVARHISLDTRRGQKLLAS